MFPTMLQAGTSATQSFKKQHCCLRAKGIKVVYMKQILDVDWEVEACFCCIVLLFFFFSESRLYD